MCIQRGGVLGITNRLWPIRPSYPACYAIVICGLYDSNFFFSLHHKGTIFGK